MKTIKAGLALAAVLAGIAAYAIGQGRAGSPTTAPLTMPTTDRMPMADFKRLMATNNVVILDVRAADSYAAGHIPGALSMPEETLTAAVAEKLKKMGKPIATYCS
jgi:predicted sulfurtransferase